MLVLGLGVSLRVWGKVRVKVGVMVMVRDALCTKRLDMKVEGAKCLEAASPITSFQTVCTLTFTYPRYLTMTLILNL